MVRQTRYSVLRRIFAICVVAVMAPPRAFCGGRPETSELDWPQWRGPTADGHAPETDWDPLSLADGPKVLWTAGVGTGYSNVSIAGGRLYTMGNSKRRDTVVCLNAETGEEIWRYSYECPGMGTGSQATPVVDSGRVYALSKKGHLHCLRARNGKLKWNVDLVADHGVVQPIYGFAGTPVVEGDVVLLTGNSAGAALDADTGKPLWISRPADATGYEPSSGSQHGTPVVYEREGTQYALIPSVEGLHSVEVETGAVQWRYPWWETEWPAHATEPLAFGTKVFVTRYDEAGCVLLETENGTPEEIWRNENLSCDISTPVLVDGYIYGWNGGPEVAAGTLRCLNATTGEIMWEEGSRKKVVFPVSDRKENAALIYAAGDLIILYDNGTLCVAEATPAGYNEISSCRLPSTPAFNKWWQHPVLCDGRIYARNVGGELVCIDVRSVQ